jgi:hypothetical protein
VWLAESNRTTGVPWSARTLWVISVRGGGGVDLLGNVNLSNKQHNHLHLYRGKEYVIIVLVVIYFIL